MTVINNIEIDDIQYNKNVIKEAITNNDKIEDKLHVIAVISNPCLFARRYILMKEFIQRMALDEPDVILYVVEMAYKKQRFLITDKDNKRHLQIRTEVPLWHKENMVNLGVKYLLPENWKAMAWIDADLDFESSTWASDTLKVLNGSKDIVHLFSHCIDMNHRGEAMQVFTSFGHQYTKELPYFKNLVNFWHPGYAWACTRKAYDKMGGLYEDAILGSADNIMALSLIQKGVQFGINSESTDDYKRSVFNYQEKVKNFRVGYIPGVIRHFYHGSKKNRQYGDRWKILVKYEFSPIKHLTRNEEGILVPTEHCPPELLTEIYQYFKERNEDEMYQTTDISLKSNLESFQNILSQEKPASFVIDNTIDEDDDMPELIECVYEKTPDRDAFYYAYYDGWESDNSEEEEESDDESVEEVEVNKSIWQKVFEAVSKFINPDV
jgi:hypothetical protein